MTAPASSEPEAYPDVSLRRARPKTRRFHAPHGGDPGVPGRPISLSYNPRPGTEAKKATIRRAAARLLARHSITALSISIFAQEAGWPPNGIRYYYLDTDDLLTDELIEHLMALNAAICTAFDATQEAPAAERMTALAEAFLRVAFDQRNEHLALRLNTKLVSEARRPAVVGRSRQVIATLREALFGCVPGLEAHPVIGGLLLRQFVGSLSEAATWFHEDDRVDRLGLAQMLASQVLMVCRATADGSWVLPAPTPIPSPPTPPGLVPSGTVPSESVPSGLVLSENVASAAVPSGLVLSEDVASAAAGQKIPPAEPGTAAASRGSAGAAREPDVAVAIWLSPEQARRSLTRLVRAVQAGTEVVLTHRGLPAAKLVPATQERQRLQRAVAGYSELHK